MCRYRVLASILSYSFGIFCTAQEQDWSSVVQTTYSILTQKAYPSFSLDKALPKALNALCTIDNYSRFLGPDEYSELQETTQGEFYGIGVLLAPKKIQDNYALILDCIPNSPADKSNVQRYDKILSIDGQSVENLSIDNVARKLKGTKRNSTVTLSIIRNIHNNKTPINLTLKRDSIEQKLVNSYYFPQHRIGYCTLPLFTAHTAKQLKQALIRIQAKKPHGLILDLRDNAGGLIQAAVDCASLFLPGNTLIVSIKNRQGQIQEHFYTHFTHFKQLVHAPLVCIILVNQYTASAGEIFAGALQLYAQKSTGPTSYYTPYILILGTRTYGKGSVQELIPVGNNCALKLTTGIYCLPGNRAIDNVGITPDVQITQTYQRLPILKNKKLCSIQTDHQLQTALTILTALARTRFTTQAQVSSLAQNITQQ
jgi:carboxyl-terminal processing protease